MNLHIDSINSGRYSNSATTLLVAGRGNPELTIAHDRALAVFLCAKHCHIPIMVGRAGQPKAGRFLWSPVFPPLYVSPPLGSWKALVVSYQN